MVRTDKSKDELFAERVVLVMLRNSKQALLGRRIAEICETISLWQERFIDMSLDRIEGIDFNPNNVKVCRDSGGVFPNLKRR